MPIVTAGFGGGGIRQSPSHSGVKSIRTAVKVSSSDNRRSWSPGVHTAGNDSNATPQTLAGSGARQQRQCRSLSYDRMYGRAQMNCAVVYIAHVAKRLAGNQKTRWWTALNSPAGHCARPGNCPPASGITSLAVAPGASVALLQTPAVSSTPARLSARRLFALPHITVAASARSDRTPSRLRESLGMGMNQSWEKCGPRRGVASRESKLLLIDQSYAVSVTVPEGAAGGASRVAPNVE
jgi:hypothetical protein